MTTRITAFVALLLLLAPAARGELRIEITQGVSEAVPIAVVPFGWGGPGAAPVSAGGAWRAGFREWSQEAGLSRKFAPIRACGLIGCHMKARIAI